jgi:hypothetical protein
MVCSEVRERLVPWHDGEVGPSEDELIRGHLARCSSCARFDQRLRHTLPTPPALAPPPEVQQRLARALDVDLLLQQASAPVSRPPTPWWRQTWRALARPAQVPVGAVMVYAMLLLASFAWGLSSWWALPVGQVPMDAASSDIPADQFRPASFEPDAP